MPVLRSQMPARRHHDRSRGPALPGWKDNLDQRRRRMSLMQPQEGLPESGASGTGVAAAAATTGMAGSYRRYEPRRALRQLVALSGHDRIADVGGGLR